MKRILWIVLCFWLTSFKSQHINNGIDFSDKKNSLYLKNILERNHFFGIENMIKDPKENMYRICNTTNCVEVIKDQEIMMGRVIMAVRNLDKPESYFRRSYQLDEKQIKAIFEIVRKHNIETLPSDDKIEGWEQGFDGNVTDIEININNTYVYKRYWTSSVQSVAESQSIIKMNDEIYKAVSLRELKDKFDKENQLEGYRYYGVSYTVLKLLTKKERRQKERSKKRQ
ncbi:hypothetical protein [Chryseobacterium sp.]|uniref:hypothetical protein n=1 Tax=Chryseobacterium sp. TaxID=1871047 RepID=UPI000ED39A90|nr:hypothetical protein [Chryseobacterium sp.]HCA06060.1 hypothetical protein [Chryseobacterium sp.]